MLILSRRTGEALTIGDDVKVIILGIKGNQVRVGVEAPKDVEVHREEIYLKIQEKKEEKAKFSVAKELINNDMDDRILTLKASKELIEKQEKKEKENAEMLL